MKIFINFITNNFSLLLLISAGVNIFLFYYQSVERHIDRSIFYLFFQLFISYTGMKNTIFSQACFFSFVFLIMIALFYMLKKTNYFSLIALMMVLFFTIPLFKFSGL